MLVAAHALDRDDLAVLDREDRLHVQQVARERGRLADPAAAREVLERVDREEQPVPRACSARRARRSPRRSCRARAGAGPPSRASRSPPRRCAVSSTRTRPLALELGRGLRALERARRASTAIGSDEDPLVAGELLVGGEEVAGRRLRRRRQLGEACAAARRTRPGRSRRSRGSSRRRSARTAARRGSSGTAAAPSGKSAVESRTIAVLAAVRLHRRRPLAGSRRRSPRAPRPCVRHATRARLVAARRSRARDTDAVRQTTATPGEPRADRARRPRGRSCPADGSRAGRRPAGARARPRAAARAVVDRRDDLDVVAQPEQQLERLAEDLVVLDEDDADRRTRSSFGRDEQRVVRLSALVHLELELRVLAPRAARAGRRAPARPRRSAASAPRAAPRSRRVDDGACDLVEARRRRRRPRRRPARATRRLRTATPFRSTSREATVTAPVATAASAARIDSSVLVRVRARRRRRPSRRAPPAARRVGTTRTVFELWSAACSALMITFALFGSTIDLGRRRSLDRGEDVGRRRVHRPAAVDDARAEALEEPRGCPRRRRPRQRRSSPVARSCSRSSRCGRSGRACSRSRRRRSSPRGDPERERASRVVGVDVHLERARVADDEQRVAEPLELRLERVRVEVVALDDEHGAVAEAGELLVDRVERQLVLSTAGASGSGSPATAAAMPRTISTRPAAPASTTPASRRTSSSSGVRATQSSPRRTSACSSAAAGRPGARSASSASSRIAVSIVPSTGLRTARYAASLAPRKARGEVVAPRERPRPRRGRSARGSRRSCRARPSARRA